MFSLIARSCARSTNPHSLHRVAAISSGSISGQVHDAATTATTTSSSSTSNGAATTGTANQHHVANGKAKPITTVAFIEGSDFTLVVGNEFGSVVRSFSPLEVGAFTSLVRDTNPIHTDSTFAAGTRFKKPIVPGMLVGSLFSNLLGSTVAGTIYVSQSLRFVRPVFVDETVTATVTIAAIDRKYVTLDTRVTKENHDVAVEGEAVVYIPSIRG